METLKTADKRRSGIAVELDLLLTTKLAAKGDQQSMDKLFSLYRENVYRICFGICRDKEEASDLTNEAFLRVFKRMASEDCGQIDFKRYIFRTARNLALDFLRRRRAVPVAEIPEVNHSVQEDVNQNPEAKTLLGDQQNLVRRTMGEINDRHYQALYMAEIIDLSHAEIGDKLGIDTNAATQLIVRARRRLRIEFRKSAANTTLKGSQCNKVQTLLLKKAEDRIEPTSQTWLEEHLSSCDHCKMNLSLMEEAGTRFRHLSPPATLIFWLLRVLQGRRAKVPRRTVAARRSVVGSLLIIGAVSLLSASAIAVSLSAIGPDRLVKSKENKSQSNKLASQSIKTALLTKLHSISVDLPLTSTHSLKNKSSSRSDILTTSYMPKKQNNLTVPNNTVHVQKRQAPRIPTESYSEPSDKRPTVNILRPKPDTSRPKPDIPRLPTETTQHPTQSEPINDQPDPPSDESNLIRSSIAAEVPLRDPILPKATVNEKSALPVQENFPREESAIEERVDLNNEANHKIREDLQYLLE